MCSLTCSWSWLWRPSHASSPCSWAWHASAPEPGTCGACIAAGVRYLFLECLFPPYWEVWNCSCITVNGFSCRRKTGNTCVAGGIGHGCLLDTVVFVLAATSTGWARSDCFIVERREGDTATWVFPGKKLWISAGHIPCHYIHQKDGHEDKC